MFFVGVCPHAHVRLLPVVLADLHLVYPSRYSNSASKPRTSLADRWNIQVGGREAKQSKRQGKRSQIRARNSGTAPAPCGPAVDAVQAAWTVDVEWRSDGAATRLSTVSALTVPLLTVAGSPLCLLQICSSSIRIDSAST